MMSLSLLTPRDVERWVPEPVPSKGGSGLVAKLFTTICQALSSLTKILSRTENEMYQRCRNEFERLFLWGQGLSVADGDLEEKLMSSKELHFGVLTLLFRLGTVALQSLSQYTASPPTGSPLTARCEELRSLLNTTETLLQRPEHEEADSDRPHTPTGSDISDYDIIDLIEETSTYIDCLLDLSPSLDNPARDVQLEDSDETSASFKETFEVSSEEALIYCRRMRDRFKELPKYLVERLAEANILRATALRERRSHPVKSDSDPLIDGDLTEDLFSTTDRRITETTKSTIVSSSLFPSTVQSSSAWSGSVSKPMRTLSFDDTMSEATFASFSTTASALGMGRPRVPSMPHVNEGKIDCPICLLPIPNIHSRKEWKQHVFDDLRPYLCTVENCKESRVLFKFSGAWARHEHSHASSELSSSQCPFCSALYQLKGPAFFKHVSAHLREVSLYILPQPVDDDEEFDSNDSDPPSSAPDEETQNPDSQKQQRSSGGDEDEHMNSSPSRVNPEEMGSPTKGKAKEGVETTTTPTDTGSPSNKNNTDDTNPQAQPGTTATSSQTAPSASARSDPLDEIDLDSIIDRLLEVRGSRPGKWVVLLESEIRYLCTKGREIFISQPIFLELEAPMAVVGDMHGQYYDLLRIFEYRGFPPENNYLFLGNYVNHGKQSIETMCLLLAYKIKYPENFFILRGNHESASMTRTEGFYDECERRYNTRLWKTFVDMFNCMPLAALIEEAIFCCHGGLSPDLASMEQIRRIMRPLDIPEFGLACDLLWSDPDKDIVGWAENDRGSSFTFGPDVVSRFLQKHDMQLIIRGHQLVEDGYKFFAKRQLVTLWSAPNYGGEYDNAGAIMNIDESLLISFQILKPAEKKLRFGRR